MTLAAFQLTKRWPWQLKCQDCSLTGGIGNAQCHRQFQTSPSKQNPGIFILYIRYNGVQQWRQQKMPQRLKGWLLGKSYRAHQLSKLSSGQLTHARHLGRILNVLWWISKVFECLRGRRIDSERFKNKIFTYDSSVVYIPYASTDRTLLGATCNFLGSICLTQSCGSLTVLTPCAELAGGGSWQPSLVARKRSD